jgi:hypothetical protein
MLGLRVDIFLEKLRLTRRPSSIVGLPNAPFHHLPISVRLKTTVQAQDVSLTMHQLPSVNLSDEIKEAK